MDFNDIQNVIKNTVPDKAGVILRRLSFDLPSYRYINIKNLRKHLLHINRIFKFTINRELYKSRLTSEEMKQIINKCYEKGK